MQSGLQLLLRLLGLDRTIVYHGRLRACVCACVNLCVTVSKCSDLAALLPG